MFAFLWVSLRRRTAVTIDGYTVKLRRDREFIWIVYCEPSGRTLTLDAHPQGRENPQLLIDFPSDIAFYQREAPPLKSAAMKLDIPDAPSSPVDAKEAIRVQGRISQGLTRLKIQHEFVRPMRSGWTSFEDGKEIYHG
jgi:hypothetical protein